MPHFNQHITDIAEICFIKGVEFVVISPGSRNAPLINAFVSRFGTKCISIVDERSAGYFALGLSRIKKAPVVLICTSGTAVLNYSPSLAEAYYQHVPLLAITADRPPEWIDQQDNQTIRQSGVYSNFIKSSYQLPMEIDSEDSLGSAHEIILAALHDLLLPQAGPVHLNVPLREPLYENLPSASTQIHNLEIDIEGDTDSGYSLPADLKSQWAASGRKMIIHGYSVPDIHITRALKKISDDPQVIIIGENISNCGIQEAVSNPELILAHAEEQVDLAPDLLIYFEGQVVSKRLKKFLRKLKIKNTWRIGLDEYLIDTFSKNNSVLNIPPDKFLLELAKYCTTGSKSMFKNRWLEESKSTYSKIQSSLSALPFCDLQAFGIIFNTIPENAILELGNSSVIRYSQLFPSREDLVYFSNRGVSGIDGCLSTAVGTAYVNQGITISILGDLSFIYDSNALWNKQLPNNLRIIVINNSGGDIFNLIDGPKQQPHIKSYLQAHHPVSIQKLAEAFNLNYFCCKNEVELRNQLDTFFNSSSNTAVLEIKTTSDQNSKKFRQIMNTEIQPENM